MKPFAIFAATLSLPAFAQDPTSTPAQEWIRKLQGVMPDGQYRGVTRSNRDCQVRVSSGAGGYIAAIGFNDRKQIEFLLPPTGVRLTGTWDYPRPTYEPGRVLAVGAEFFGLSRERIRRAIILSLKRDQVHVDIEAETDELRRVTCILDARFVPGFRGLVRR